MKRQIPNPSKHFLITSSVIFSSSFSNSFSIFLAFFSLANAQKTTLSHFRFLVSPSLSKIYHDILLQTFSEALQSPFASLVSLPPRPSINEDKREFASP